MLLCCFEIPCYLMPSKLQIYDETVFNQKHVILSSDYERHYLYLVHCHYISFLSFVVTTKCKADKCILHDQFLPKLCCCICEQNFPCAQILYVYAKYVSIHANNYISVLKNSSSSLQTCVKRMCFLCELNA